MRRSLSSLRFAILVWVALGAASCGQPEKPVDAGLRTQTLLLGNGAEPADLDPQVGHHLYRPKYHHGPFRGSHRDR